jgi:hypothetical protein
MNPDAVGDPRVAGPPRLCSPAKAPIGPPVGIASWSPYQSSPPRASSRNGMKAATVAVRRPASRASLDPGFPYAAAGCVCLRIGPVGVGDRRLVALVSRPRSRRSSHTSRPAHGCGPAARKPELGARPEVLRRWSARRVRSGRPFGSVLRRRAAQDFEANQRTPGRRWPGASRPGWGEHAGLPFGQWFTWPCT